MTTTHRTVAERCLTWLVATDGERDARSGDHQRASLLGTYLDDGEIRSYLDSVDAAYEHVPDDGALCRRVGNGLARNSISSNTTRRVGHGVFDAPRSVFVSAVGRGDAGTSPSGPAPRAVRFVRRDERNPSSGEHTRRTRRRRTRTRRLTPPPPSIPQTTTRKRAERRSARPRVSGRSSSGATSRTTRTSTPSGAARGTLRR